MRRSLLSLTSMSRSPLSLTSMPRSLLSLTCTLPELLPLWLLPLWLTLLPLLLTLLPLPWLLPLPPLRTPVTTTASLPVRTLTLATLSPLPWPPLLRNREFHRGRHIGQYFPRLHPDKKSDEHATSD